MLFKVELIVNDKKLPKALTALDGLGYNLQVQPVKDAEPVQGRVREASSPPAHVVLREALRGWDSSMVKTVDIAKRVKDVLSYPALMYGIKTLKHAGILTQQRKGVYILDQSKL
jgi:hypothetical protein